MPTDAHFNGAVAGAQAVHLRLAELEHWQRNIHQRTIRFPNTTDEVSGAMVQVVLALTTLREEFDKINTGKIAREQG